jgi:hypothetical protein
MAVPARRCRGDARPPGQRRDRARCRRPPNPRHHLRRGLRYDRVAERTAHISYLAQPSRTKRGEKPPPARGGGRAPAEDTPARERLFGAGQPVGASIAACGRRGKGEAPSPCSAAVSEPTSDCGVSLSCGHCTTKFRELLLPGGSKREPAFALDPTFGSIRGLGTVLNDGTPTRSDHLRPIWTNLLLLPHFLWVDSVGAGLTAVVRLP